MYLADKPKKPKKPFPGAAEPFKPKKPKKRAALGGRPSKGTPADRRLKDNKDKPPRPVPLPVKKGGTSG